MANRIPTILKDFISKQQQGFINSANENEFADIIERIKGIIETMPKTYETDNIKADDKIVYLHYFNSGSDYYIVEKDSVPDEPQQQAYGYAILNGDLINAEWGYISIEELIENGVELDLHFAPTPFGQLKETFGENKGRKTTAKPAEKWSKGIEKAIEQNDFSDKIIPILKREFDGIIMKGNDDDHVEMWYSNFKYSVSGYLHPEMYYVYKLIPPDYTREKLATIGDIASMSELAARVIAVVKKDAEDSHSSLDSKVDESEKLKKDLSDAVHRMRNAKSMADLNSANFDIEMIKNKMQNMLDSISVSKTPTDDLIQNENINLTKRDDTVAPNAAETSAAEVIQPKEVQNAAESNVYEPQSAVCTTIDTTVPLSMKYEIRKSLEGIDREVNGIDDYVADKLGFTPASCSKEEYSSGMKCLCNAFSAEQVDALAVAIYNIEEKGQACIVGDMTGIGKGRIAAGMVLYAHRNGKLPIFFTEKDNLFSDIYRDLIDISADAGIPQEFVSEEPQRKIKKYTQKEVDEMIAEAKANGEDIDEVMAQIEENEANNFVEEYVYRKNPNYQAEINEARREHKSILVPFILNNQSAKTNKAIEIKDTKGNILYKSFSGENKNKILESGNIAGYDFVLTTYSQISGEKENLKKTFLRKIAPHAIFILDESHNASGSSNTGVYLQNLLAESKGATFLSATFAKRPDNMPIYASKTSISEANLNSEQLVEAIKSGGVALQEILSSQLVREGQMIRRERSFEGIEVNYIYLDQRQEFTKPEFNKEIEHKAIYDSATEIMRLIIDFQQKHVDPVIKDLDKKAKAAGKQADSKKGTKGAGVDNQPVFNGIFQATTQLLFSIKAESVAEQAIERMKQGKKPIIAFASTMESFLDTLTNDDGTKVEAGDIINADFSVILKRRLDKVLQYTIIQPTGDRIHESIEVAAQSEQFQAAYKFVLSKINKAVVGISISPIDMILQKITEAGFTVAEVTGRKRYLNLFENGTAEVRTRVKKGVSDLFRDFNENKIDCLLINQSGSTGASAHAIKTSKVTKVKKDELGNIVIPNSLEPRDEVKQRVMIVLQPELNINTEVQKRGRINRTGQIYKPIYDYVISAVPAEKRLVMMLKKKLSSLDANTTSNQKNSSQFEGEGAIDFLNKYGDEIIFEYLAANPKVNQLTGDIFKISGGTLTIDSQKLEDAKKSEEDAAHRLSGRVAILSTKEQEDFYAEISSGFSSLVQYYKETGEYDMEVDSVNLEAETIDKTVVVLGKGGESLFGRNSILEKCNVNILKKPMKRVEVEKIIKDELTVDDTEITPKQHTERLIKSLYSSFENLLVEQKAKNKIYWDNVIEDIKNEKGYLNAPTKHDAEQYRIERLKEIADARVQDDLDAEDSNHNKRTMIERSLKFFTVGKTVAYPATSYKQDQKLYKAVFIGFAMDMKSKNPFVPSKIKLRFAFPNSLKYLAVPLSKSEIVDTVTARTYDWLNYNENILSDWDEIAKANTSDRGIRYIVTGNILQAIGDPTYSVGKLISYTVKDKKDVIRKGILMPDYFNPNQVKVKGEDRVTQLKITVPILTALPLFERMDERRIFTTSNDSISIGRSNRGDYTIFLQGKKADYDIFLQDAVILNLSLEKNFEKLSSTFRTTIPANKIGNLLSYLQDKFSLTVQITQGEYGSLGLKAETDYEDELQTIEPAIKKITEADLKIQKQLDEEKAAATAAEDLKKANEQKEREELESKSKSESDLQRRKDAARIKILRLIAYLKGEVPTFKKGGSVPNKKLESIISDAAKKREKYAADGIVVSDATWNKFLAFGNKNFDKMEKFIKQINEDGYVYELSSGISMDGNGRYNFNNNDIQKVKINIQFNDTQIYKMPYAEGMQYRYKVTLGDGNISDIFANELVAWMENGFADIEDGIWATSKEGVQNGIKARNGQFSRGGGVSSAQPKLVMPLNPSTQKAYDLGVKRHDAEGTRVAWHDADLRAMLDAESSDNIQILLAWTKGWDDARVKEMKQKFPEMYEHGGKVLSADEYKHFYNLAKSKDGYSEEYDELSKKIVTMPDIELALDSVKNADEFADYMINKRTHGEYYFPREKAWQTDAKMKEQREYWSGRKFSKGGAITHPEKVGVVMGEFKEGTLKTSAGKKVKTREQAIAIALSEATKINKKHQTV